VAARLPNSMARKGAMAWARWEIFMSESMPKRA